MDGSTRAFGLRAQNPRHGSQATIVASLVATGPEFTNPDLAHYTLTVLLTLKHRAGAGRPSITAADIQREIESEIEKRLTNRRA